MQTHPTTSTSSRQQRSPISCEQCGKIFTPRDAGGRFCSQACYRQWWKLNAQAQFSAQGIKKQAELKAAGHDPAHSGEATRRRSEKIALSNRLHPRRKKRDGSTPQPALSPTPEVVSLPTPTSVMVGNNEKEDDTAWAERGQYWVGKADTSASKRGTVKNRGKERGPLILTGHGVQLRIDHGALLVRNGFTHYPQKRQEWRFFPGDKKLPSRIVLLDTDGSLSLDVVKWLGEQHIPLLVLNWQGSVVSVFGGDNLVADLDLRQAQVAVQTNGTGLQLAIQLIRDKVAGCKAALRTLPTSSRELAMRKLDMALEELHETPPMTIEALRLVEARAALAYFTSWQTLSLRWKGTGRHPIPQEWQMIGQRGSPLAGGTNRNASHPMNALLNYAYGVLESQVRIATIATGLDPMMGYLHACHPGRVALVYDLMEPLRPQVDRLVLKFVGSHTFTPADFVLTGQGVCRLHPQLARTIAGLALGDQVVQEVVMRTVATLRAAVL
jgi:CRISPR-associated protein Cas1